MYHLCPREVVTRIASLQTQNDPVFGSGLFAAYRSQPTWLGYQRPDVNVFFTASTVFVLQQLRPQLTPDLQTRIDAISMRAQAAYPIFQNKDGLNTYNFWPTRPSRHFPNGLLFHRFDHFRIPDDIDDTAMVYLTTQPTPADLQWLKNKLAQHANLNVTYNRKNRIRNTFPDYRNLTAYSTWFGKNMPIDFDACALSNVLYCIYRYQLPQNQHDLDSLTYLRSIIETGHYSSQPFRCSPHYARPALIIYHVARLMAAFRPTELEPVRVRLLTDALTEFGQVHNRLDKLLLAIAIHRLDPTFARQQLSPVDLTNIAHDFPTFHFFIAGLLTAYEHPWLNVLANKPFFHLRWQCEAHSWALVLEYLCLDTPKMP